nr:MAG TPA: hypothetical protein [Caudoviricetes sp.]
MNVKRCTFVPSHRMYWGIVAMTPFLRAASPVICGVVWAAAKKSGKIAWRPTVILQSRGLSRHWE